MKWRRRLYIYEKVFRTTQEAISKGGSIRTENPPRAMTTGDPCIMHGLGERKQEHGGCEWKGECGRRLPLLYFRHLISPLKEARPIVPVQPRVSSGAVP